MKNKKSRMNNYAAAGIMALLPLTGVAETSKSSNEGFTVSPMVGRYFPAGNRLLDDDDFQSIAVGYDFAQDWGIELSYLTANPDFTGTSEEVDFDVLKVDALYYFNDERWRPYAVFGLGEADIEAFGQVADDDVANLGIGAKYAINHYLAFRADARLLQGIESGESDYIASVGAVFKFGGDKKPRPVAVKQPKVLDADKDGVIDAEDKCPATPVGTPVDASGCKLVLDTDKDGVVDAQDKCPDTAAGAKVDEVGCYLTLKEDVSVSLNVNFATNSDQVVSESFEDIEELATFLKSYPLTKVVIEGHTDSMGSAEYNRNLSQRRAQSVANILSANYGIDAARVEAIGYGEEKPLFDNATAEGREKNRRVTAVVKTTIEKVVK